jgi:hypothetical protein
MYEYFIKRAYDIISTPKKKRHCACLGVYQRPRPILCKVCEYNRIMRATYTPSSKLDIFAYTVFYIFFYLQKRQCFVLHLSVSLVDVQRNYPYLRAKPCSGWSTTPAKSWRQTCWPLSSRTTSPNIFSARSLTYWCDYIEYRRNDGDMPVVTSPEMEILAPVNSRKKKTDNLILSLYLYNSQLFLRFLVRFLYRP